MSHSARKISFFTFFFLTLFFLLSAYCFAEKIILKSGQVVEGKIVEETDKYIKLEVVGVPVTFYKDEIKNIKGKISNATSDSGVEALPYADQPQVKKYLELIQKEPNNYEHYMALAGFYAGTGDGDLVLKYIEKALQLNPQEAIKKDAYKIAAMGAYSAGEFKKSYEYIEKALQVNSQDEIAKSFKDMLEQVSKRDWGGKIPEKISWYGYKSAGEWQRSVLKEGMFKVGNKEDMFYSEAFSFKIIGPQDWFKEISPLPQVAIIYKKYKNEPRSAFIKVTKNKNPTYETVLDVSNTIKAELMQKQPSLVFDGPKEVLIKEMTASRMDMKDTATDLRVEWYIFSIKRCIITFQYWNTFEQFDIDHDVFEKMLHSFAVGGGQ